MNWGSRCEKFMSRPFYNLAAFDFEIFDFLFESKLAYLLVSGRFAINRNY